jgi:hypothetical protein
LNKAVAVTEFIKILGFHILLVLSGYGCATTFWLLHNKPNYLKQFNRSARHGFI